MRARKHTLSSQRHQEFSQWFTGRMTKRGPHLALVRGTPRAEVNVIGAQLTTVLICQGNVSLSGTFTIRLLPNPINCKYQPQRATLLVVYASFCDSQPMGSFWQEIEKFIIRQSPKGEKDDYSWISDGLPSSSRRRRRGDGR